MNEEETPRTISPGSIVTLDWAHMVWSMPSTSDLQCFLGYTVDHQPILVLATMPSRPRPSAVAQPSTDVLVQYSGTIGWITLKGSPANRLLTP